MRETLRSGKRLTHLAVRRGSWLRGYTCSFIETLAPTLSRAVVETALVELHAST